MKPSKSNIYLDPSIMSDSLIDRLTEDDVWLNENSIQHRILDTSPSLEFLFPTCEENDAFFIKSPCLTDTTLDLSSRKYLIDSSAFSPDEHGVCLQQSLLDIGEKLTPYTNNLYDTLNLPELNAAECETARLLRAAEIHTPIALHSLELADSLQGLSSLNMDYSPEIDETLLNPRLLRGYSSLVEHQYSQIQKDIENLEASESSIKSSINRLKVIELATDVIQDQISVAAQHASADVEDDSVCAGEIQLADAKNVISYMPSYLGYTLRENSRHDVLTEFEKSLIGRIIVGGKDIAHKIQDINELCMAGEREAIFTPTTKMYGAIQCISASFSVDSVTFGCVIDSLYMLIYEGSGSAKRITSLLTDSECSTLWLIKNIRTDFRHDIEHGNKTKYLAKKKEIADAYYSLCGQPRPIKQRDWVNAHCELFEKVNAFLQLIIDKLSSNMGESA